MPLTYPQILDLDKLKVQHEDDPSNPKYFNVNGLPNVLGYGKYWFTITFNDPKDMPLIKDNSNIIFEVKDENGLVIWSDVADLDDVNGAAVCWLWIKEDPLRTYEQITAGTGTLTIVAVLEDDNNLRLTLPIDIRPNVVNNHSILFQEEPQVRIKEILKTDKNENSQSFLRNFATIETNNLVTYGGKVDKVEVSYNTEQIIDSSYQQLGTYQLDLPNDMLVGYYESGSFGTPVGNFREETFDEIIKNWNQSSGSRISSSNINHIVASQSMTTKDGDTTGSLAGFIGLFNSVRFKNQAPAKPDRSSIRYRSKIKTLEQENDFILEYTVSGSGFVAVYAVPASHTGSSFAKSDSNNRTGSWPHDEPIGTKYQIYKRDFGLFNPSSSGHIGLGHMDIDDKIVPTPSDGTDYAIRKHLTIPKDRYFFIDIGSTGTRSHEDITKYDVFPEFYAKNVSFKLKPQKGTNPYYYTSKIEIPTTRRDQTLNFKVRFLNPNNEYSQYLHSGSIDAKPVLSQSFKGSPLIIEKSDNILKGNLLIGPTSKTNEIYGKLGWRRYGTTDSASFGRGYVTLTNDDPSDFGDKIIFDESGSNSRIIISGSGIGSIGNNTKEPETGIILYASASDFGERRTSIKPGAILVDGDISASGNVYAREYHITYTSASILYQSGSTKFGDSDDDEHVFTGSMIISGNVRQIGGNHTLRVNDIFFNHRTSFAGIYNSIHNISPARASTKLSGEHISLQGGPGGLLEDAGDDAAGGNIYIAGGVPLGNAPPGNVYLNWYTSSIIPAKSGSIGGSVIIGGQSLTRGAPPVSTSAQLTVYGDISSSGDLHLTNISASGTIAAEHFHSSDDAHIGDDLDVDGDINVGEDIKMQQEQSLKFQMDTGQSSMLRVDSTDGLQLGSSTLQNLLIQGGGSANNYMLISGSGAFGIGTAAPPKTLTVEGEISASGGITTNGGILTKDDIWMGNGQFLYMSNYAGSSNGAQAAMHRTSADILNVGLVSAGYRTTLLGDGTSVYLSGSRVGIQTPGTIDSIPSTLTVVGDISASSHIYMDNGTNIYARDGNGVFQRAVGFGTVGGDPFHYFGDGDVETQIFGSGTKLVLSASNVGIDTYEPTKPLTVVGDISASAGYPCTFNMNMHTTRTNPTTWTLYGSGGGNAFEVLGGTDTTIGDTEPNIVDGADAGTIHTAWFIPTYDMRINKISWIVQDDDGNSSGNARFGLWVLDNAAAEDTITTLSGLKNWTLKYISDALTITAMDAKTFMDNNVNIVIEAGQSVHVGYLNPDSAGNDTRYINCTVWTNPA